MMHPSGPGMPDEHHASLQARRALKAAEAIRQVVSMAILRELKDPRIRDVTVTYVEVSPDLRHAKVHVSVMGDETKQRLSLRGLRSAAGYLQAKCAERIDTRWTPKLEFVLDQGVKKSIEIARILEEVLPGQPRSTSSAEESQADTESQEDTESGEEESPDESTDQELEEEAEGSGPQENDGAS